MIQVSHLALSLYKLYLSGVAREEWVGPDLSSHNPTSVKTPPEICANPLKGVLYVLGGGGGGGGVPCMYIVTFYCSLA